MSRLVTPLPEMRAAAPDLVGALEPVYIAETEAEREAVFSFRYSVYAAELGRKLGGADHGRQRVYDPEDDKPYTTLPYTDDLAGRLTGTTRIRRWEPGQVPAKDWETLSMERFEGLRDMPTAEIGRLMIEPGRRGAARPGLDVVCGVPAVRRGAGGRCRVHQLRGGPGAPLPAARLPHLCGQDGADRRRHRGAAGADPSVRAYLEQAGSFVAPFADLFYGLGKRASVDVGRWARLLDADSAPVRFDAAAVWERVDRLRQVAGQSMLEALSEATVRKLSDRGFLMDVPAGHLLTEKGLTRREIYVILDGAFEVHDGDRRIAVLGPGDVIGEIGFFGTSGRRVASVTAASDGQALVVRRRFVDELMKSDPACAAEILFGLARVLADRQYALA